MRDEKTFDYIVVGAGSAGCVVANRLSADAVARVLLLEAGPPDTRGEIHDPAGMIGLWGSDLDWGYETEPEPRLDDRKVPIARGKVLGGSSSLNAMIYIRGNRRDFDHWNYLGNEGWSHDEVLPYFKKSENFLGGASAYHGTGGPLTVIDYPGPTPVATAFVNAAVELGFGGPGWDFNGEQQEDGAGFYQLTVTREGKRCSSATAFLAPIRDRPNLIVETSAHVTRVRTEGGRAVGVEYVHDGETRWARAEREIVCSAGAFDSPKLLMLSGIGPADHLKSHGLPVVVDLPGVGQNLQDHLLLPVFYRSRRTLPVPSFIAEAGLFVRTRAGLAAAAPDLQFHFSAGIPAFSPVPEPNFAFVPILVRPQSRGTIALRSPNPFDRPVIRADYLQATIDLEVLVKGIELSRNLAATRAFADFRGEEIAPGPGRSPKDLRAFVRGHCSTVWHVAGTCRMGHDAHAVVDAQLRVHGIDRLRVADASVMPAITSGNTNAACIMIGEKVADMILRPRRESGR